jgi:hypothetical protein
MSEGAGVLHARGCCPLKGELVSGRRILSRDNWSLFTVRNSVLKHQIDRIKTTQITYHMQRIITQGKFGCFSA